MFSHDYIYIYTHTHVVYVVSFVQAIPLIQCMTGITYFTYNAKTNTLRPLEHH